MKKKLTFVSLPNMYYMLAGLSFDAVRCSEVLDSVLTEINRTTGIPDKILRWNRKGGLYREPLIFPGYGEIVIRVEQRISSEGKILCLVNATEHREGSTRPPLVLFHMQSITLQIPMRLEVPLRALLKGDQRLKDTYLVYLHSLFADDDSVYTYYGVTKRGWNLRFMEHVKSSFGQDSRRLFPSKMNELVRARVSELTGDGASHGTLQGLSTTVCAVLLDEDSAMDIEEYLVDKYSLSSKHPLGLNMIPGGREGIRMLNTFAKNDRKIIDTEDREAAFEEYLKANPQIGIPKPGVSAKWNDPEYAEAVICGRENRLTGEQVREIRYLAAGGLTPEQITEKVGAIDVGQTKRVIVGRTYSRIH